MVEQTNSKAPGIRFRDFKGDWEQNELGKLFPISSAARVHKNEWTKSGVPFFRSSDVVSNFKNNDNIKVFISLELYEQLSAKVGRIKKGDILVTGGGSIGIPYLVNNNEPLYFKDADLLWFKIRETVDSQFLFTFLSSEPFRRYLKSISHIGTISHYTIEQAKKTPVTLPNDTKEQNRIGRYFRELNRLIGFHQRKHDKLVTLKKAMLQKMFPQPGATTPEIRFEGFSGDWVEKKLGNIFSYERPDHYIVRSSVYSKENKTPVLTANKAFILGYTNESRSFDRPCIIFDDFTLESKYVDFPFMIKSSAIKLLTIQDSVVDDLYFAFLVLNKAETEIMGHARHYISVVQPTLVRTPKIAEQQKIGSYFRALDALITKYAIQLQKLKQLKSACLEKMFV